MRTTYSIFVHCALAALSTIVCQPSTARAQGSLTPPGPPSPTMKSLSQIEPRTPISLLPYSITNPGSYYVTANLTGVAGTNGITITVGSVEIDLMGFVLIGVPGSGDGVSVPTSQMNISIHDGNLQGWGGYGVNGTNASNSHLERLRAFSNTAGGLALGNASVICDCEASSNLWHGITVGNGSVVRDSTASANSGAQGPSSGSGIVGGNSIVVSGCAATLNWGWGIALGDDSTISSCSASSDNLNYLFGGILTGNGCTITSCTANKNLEGEHGNGIVTGNSCIIKECTANYNNAGIVTGTGCNIIECIACFNAVGTGEGIVAGDISIVRGCVVNGNTYGGIYCGNNCFIIDNASLGNLVNYYPDIVASGSNNVVIHNLIETNWFLAPSGYSNPTNNSIGTVESPSSLNTNKNPHANFRPH